MNGVCRLRLEADRAGEYMCEVNQLKEQLASRDRVVIEINSELESFRQQITKLNNDHQTTLRQLQLTQNARYILNGIAPGSIKRHGAG